MSISREVSLAAMDDTYAESICQWGSVRKATLSVTFDSGNGAFRARTLGFKIDGILQKLVTNPGSTAPTNNYSITLKDPHGIDVLHGVGATRSSTNSEDAAIAYTGTSMNPCVSPHDVLTLDITGNTEPSATTEIAVYWMQG